jgi:predicted Zn-dependent peptidase
VNSFHSQDLRSLIKKKYTSDKVVIAAAGNLEHSELCDLVEKNFSFASAAKPHPVKKIPPVSAKRLEWNRSIAQSHIIIGTRSFQYSDRRKYPFLVLNTILGGGMSSRLFQSIRETFGLAYSVYTFTESLSDTGMWGVYIGTDRNKVENVIALVLAEFGKIIKDKITAHELARIKAQLKGNLMLGLEGTSSRMNRLAKMEIYLHDFISLDSIIEEIDKVQLEEVVEVANEVLDRNKLLTIIFTP